MTQKTTTNSRKRKKAKAKARRIFWLRRLRFLLAAAILAALLFLPQQTTKESLVTIQKTVEKTVQSAEDILGEAFDLAQENIFKTKKTAPPEETTDPAAEQPLAIQQENIIPDRQNITELHKRELQIAEDQTQPEPEAIINAFFTHLDHQQYIQKFSLHGSSREHFSDLAQKLLDTPPIVMEETKDLYTLLKNTAHFFRILGKNNVLLLKGILHQEKEQFEEIMRALYLVGQDKTRLEKMLSITFDEKALYDYATFFLDTVGGRLYLFRRDSSSRMVVTYYAICLLDQANSRHNSPHGTDIRPAINALIEEMKNGGNNLRFRDKYLEKLRQLQEKYRTTQ